MYRSRRVRISGTGSHVPSRIVTNETLEQAVDTNAAWILKNLGIRERRICEDHEYTSDIAAKAGLHALESAGVAREDVDLIIVATATPDRKAPSTACLVKHKMGITNTCPAFDLAAVCSGFLYSLSIGSTLIQNGIHRRVLIIGADTFSKITDWSQRDCVFFGDGAGAAVLEASSDERAFFASKIFSETANTDHFTVFPEDQYFTMNGRAVFETGSNVLPEAIRSVLYENGFTLEDISCIIPHQPSRRLLEATAEKLGIPSSKVKTNMEFYANTSGATIPLLLDEVNRRGEISDGDLIVFAAVGSGWTWGAALYRWH